SAAPLMASTAMDHLASLIGIGAVAFISTNIDDLVLLIGFFADRRYRPREIVAGQFAGIVALIFASIFGAMIARPVPTEYVGLLGFVPIGIAARQLLVARAADGEGAHDLARRRSNVAAVVLVTISNGGDNLGLYIPLFSVHSDGEIALFSALFLALTALWCAAGYALVS